MIILPGNHDAVRPAEPQPALDPEVQQDYSDTTFVGNPCDFSLHGVRILSYHGKSIDDFVATLRSVSYSQPERAMQVNHSEDAGFWLESQHSLKVGLILPSRTVNHCCSFVIAYKVPMYVSSNKYVRYC